MSAPALIGAGIAIGFYGVLGALVLVEGFRGLIERRREVRRFRRLVRAQIAAIRSLPETERGPRVVRATAARTHTRSSLDEHHA